MEKWQGRVALITGANSGIGAALCHNLLKYGMIVVGVDKDITNIEKVSKESEKKGTLVAMKCDITKDEEVYATFEQIKKKLKGVDVCINNAGFTIQSTLLNGEPTEWRGMMNVNVVALCLFTKLSVASMRERNVDDGHIINLCSVTGHTVYDVPEFHFYSSTKWAVRALTEGLRQELEKVKSRIRVSQISPGVVKTNFYSKITPELLGNIDKNFPSLRPEQIADVIEHMLSLPPDVEIQDVIVTGKL